ncbi:NAD-dependent epimerase/dehydratase family protein [Candidatus Microgenomates bacterium]|nr:MAG: NAD-dependent epimerase/dehydratase family protein [Candidatus Microgenomates bacterium]
MKKNRVLITGGAGFIGSHTADLLHSKGYKIRILDNLSSKTHNGQWPTYLKRDFELMRGDVRYKKHWYEAMRDIDYVIHLAGWMDLTPDFSQFASVNMVGTANLYETIVKNNLSIKKVILASSQFLYGEGEWSCKTHGRVFPGSRKGSDLQKGIWDPLCPKTGCEIKIVYDNSKESHFPHPPNQYSISKLAMENMAMTLGKQYAIPSVAMRYSIVHGARQTVKSAYSGALRIFTLQMLSRQNPTIYEDGKQTRDFVHIQDVANANLAVLESSETAFNIYNVGSGRAYSIIDLAKMVSEKLNVKVNIAPCGKYRIGDNRHSVSSIQKIKKLGWEPKHSEQEAVSDFVEWVTKQDSFANINKTHKSMLNSGVIKNTTL